MAGERTKAESVASTTGFAFGMADAIAVSALLNADREAGPLGGSVLLGLVVMAALSALVFKAVRRNTFVAITIATFLPIAVTSFVAREIGYTTDTAQAIRGVGLI